MIFSYTTVVAVCPVSFATLIKASEFSIPSGSPAPVPPINAFSSKCLIAPPKRLIKSDSSAIAESCTNSSLACVYPVNFLAVSWNCAKSGSEAV